MNRRLIAAITLLTGSTLSAQSINFVHDVQPILRRHCYRCHGSQNQEASLQLNQRRSVLGPQATNDSGEPVVVTY